MHLRLLKYIIGIAQFPLAAALENIILCFSLISFYSWTIYWSFLKELKEYFVVPVVAEKMGSKNHLSRDNSIMQSDISPFNFSSNNCKKAWRFQNSGGTAETYALSKINIR